jgi:8-oxo-dGTP pyrophosphatase MutT (NUDIX family)
MEKFSKLEQTDLAKTSGDDVLYQNEYLTVLNYDGWSIIKEPKDCVIIIPILIERNIIVLRNEYIPTYKYVDSQSHHLTVIAGQIEEGETAINAAIRELEEEAGLVLRSDYNVEIEKTLFVSKTQANKYHIIIMPLTEMDYDQKAATGDGSDSESKSNAVFVETKYINNLYASDVITELMIYKAKEYLNMF